MTFNSSDLTPDSVVVHEFVFGCFKTTVGLSYITSYTLVVLLLLLPLCVYILRRGCAQRFKASPSSHSDFFTYHVVVMEVLCMAVSGLCFLGALARVEAMVRPWVFFLPFNLSGQMMFHILSCAERYLAIVHPVTYMSLKSDAALRARSWLAGGAWFLTTALMTTVFMSFGNAVTIFSVIFLGTCLLSVTFCNVSALCYLIRPGPGGRAGKDGQRVSPAKRRAFYSILAIFAVVALRATGCSLTIYQGELLHLDKDELCALWLSVLWFSLPSSLVLPLLFLQRAGTVPLCKRK